jgi:TolB-like protein
MTPDGRPSRATLSALVFALLSLLLWSGAALAQEGDGDTMDFGGGDQSGQEEGGDTMDFGGEGDGSMDFSLDEAQEAIPEGGLRITGIVVRTEDSVENSVLNPLSEKLITELDQLNGFQVVANLELRDRFATMGEQGTLDCVFNPVCLGRLGTELGLQRIVVGRLSGTDGSYTLNMDLVNVEESLIADYTSRTVQGDLDDLKEVVKPSVARLFNIRQVRVGRPQEQPEPEIGTVQKTLAWTTLGASAVSLGLGIYFGLEAKGVEDDLNAYPREDINGQNVYSLTPVQAQAMLEDGESSALLSNIFFGVGIAAGVTSALLFLIKPGSDIATEEELQSDRLELFPVWGSQGAGVGAQYRW